MQKVMCAIEYTSSFLPVFVNFLNAIFRSVVEKHWGTAHPCFLYRKCDKNALSAETALPNSWTTSREWRNSLDRPIVKLMGLVPKNPSPIFIYIFRLTQLRRILCIRYVHCNTFRPISMAVVRLLLSLVCQYLTLAIEIGRNVL